MAIAAGIATGFAAATHQHRGGLRQQKVVRNLAAAKVGAIAEPAMATAAASAQQIGAGRQLHRLRSTTIRLAVRHAHRFSVSVLSAVWDREETEAR